MLVSRSEDKLKVTAKELSKLGVKVDWIVSDAGDCSEANFERVVKKCTNLRLSLLINNVGVNQGGRAPLHELDPQAIEQCIKINCLYPTLLTHHLLPLMVKDPSPKAIINLASVAGLTVNPFSSVYSGSKSYNRLFSLAIASEYLDQGIEVLSVSPGFVSTPMTRMRESSVVCTAEQCARNSLARIGQVDIIPHWKHVMMMVGSQLTLSLLPWDLALRSTNRILRKFHRK